jgi:hypothetical protein
MSWSFLTNVVVFGTEVKGDRSSTWVALAVNHRPYLSMYCLCNALARQIAGNHQAATFVTIGQECKQHLHLLTAVLEVSDVIYVNRIIARELF